MTVEILEPITVHEAISRVINDVGGVARDGYNDHQKFAFRSIEGTVNAVRPALLEHGLTVVPSYKSIAHTDYTRDDGKVVHRAVLEGTFQVTGPGGDDVFVTTIGEATDMEGRASNKAQSAALKYALLQLFFIGSGEDGDAADHAPQTRAPSAQVRAPQPPPGRVAASPAAAVAARAAQAPPAGRPDTGEKISQGQKSNCWRLFKKLESEAGWSLDDYKDQIEAISGVRDDRELTKDQASDLIRTLKDFAGEEDSPPPSRAPEPEYTGAYDDTEF